MNLKETIATVLYNHSSCCLDNDADLERVTEALVKAIGDSPPLSYEDVADRLDRLALELRMRAEKERDALKALDRIMTGNA